MVILDSMKVRKYRYYMILELERGAKPINCTNALNVRMFDDVDVFIREARARPSRTLPGHPTWKNPTREQPQTYNQATTNNRQQQHQ
jgi:hypothetical protein